MTGGAVAGSDTLTGVTVPEDCLLGTCSGVQIYTCAAGDCTVGSATPIGSPVCSDASGNFTVTVPPLVAPEFIFAYDTCTGRMGPIDPVRLSGTEAPAMSSRMIGVLAGMLALIGLFGLLRLRRDL